MRSLDESLREKLLKRQQAGLMRKLSTHRLPYDFFSNDYLGLARSEELFKSIETLHHKTGIQNGSTGSRLLGGNSSFLERTEKYLAEIFRSEASLIFNSGYTAN